MFFQGIDGLIGQFVITQCAYGDGLVHAKKLPGMIGKVGGRTTQFLTFGKHIPQHFSESYYISFVHLIGDLRFKI